MKHLLNKIIISVLLSAMMMAVHAVTAHVGEVTAASVEDEQALENKVHQGKKHQCKHVCTGAHKEAYMLLLAEKFTPDQMQQWQQTVNEHRQLKAQWRDKMQNMNKSEKKQWKKEMRKQWEENGETWRSLHKQFNQAIEVWMDHGRTEEISQMMPKLLEQMKEHNRQMRERM